MAWRKRGGVGKQAYAIPDISWPSPLGNAFSFANTDSFHRMHYLGCPSHRQEWASLLFSCRAGGCLNPYVWLTQPFADKLLVNEVPGWGLPVRAGRVTVSGLVPCPILSVHLGPALRENQATALGCWRKLSYIFASKLCFGLDGSVCVQSAWLCHLWDFLTR